MDNNLLEGVRRWLEPLPETVAAAKIPGVYSNSYVLEAQFLEHSLL